MKILIKKMVRYQKMLRLKLSKLEYKIREEEPINLMKTLQQPLYKTKSDTNSSLTFKSQAL